MKKSLLSILVFSTLVFVSACGNGNDNTDGNNDANNDNTPTEQANDSGNNGNAATDQGNNGTGQDNAQNGGATDNSNMATSNLPFTSFDLDVEYGQNQSFEVNYDNERDDREAKIEDDKNNQVLSGEEAFQELNNRFQNFKFDKSTADDDVINEVIKSFELDENYTKFELDITYADGTEKEYIKTK